jgi:hypothetical protein
MHGGYGDDYGNIRFRRLVGYPNTCSHHCAKLNQQGLHSDRSLSKTYSSLQLHRQIYLL